MKKLLILFLIAIALLCTSCSNQNEAVDNTSTNKDLTTGKEDNSMNNTSSNEEVTTNEPTPVENTSDLNQPTEAAAIEEVANNDNLNEDPADKEIKALNIETVDKIPSEYLVKRTDQAGTIEKISYQTKDYFGDGSEITKNAYVYLPYNYDKTKQYNVLYLMHGIGGSEIEWGMHTDSSQVKIMMDNLIFNGDIEPFIIVTPNGRSSAINTGSSADFNSFYVFGKELRNDLIPYIDSNYSTFAEYDEKGYDLTAARDHRAMAGLSMGGMQTINIGLGESLDIISDFGAFSACPTTNPATKIAELLKGFPDYNINSFYNICGTEDTIASPSATAAVTSLTDLTDKLADGKNFIWQQVSGGHDFNVWYLGFYNFAKIAFQTSEE